VTVKVPSMTSDDEGRSMDHAPLLLSISDAARRLGVSRTTLHKELDAGTIGYKRVQGDRRIPYAELIAYSKRNIVKAAR
jgi:excisionase family DNA binding protein